MSKLRCSLFVSVFFLLLSTPLAFSDSLVLKGNLYSVSLPDLAGDPTATEMNASLANVQLDAFSVKLTFTGSISGAGSYTITGTEFTDLTASASETSFDVQQLLVTGGSTYQFFGTSCVLGADCNTGNALFLMFQLPLSGLNSNAGTPSSIPFLKDFELMEDDGVTDVIGSLNSYSYSADAVTPTVPEPATLILIGSVSLLAWKRRRQ